VQKWWEEVQHSSVEALQLVWVPRQKVEHFSANGEVHLPLDTGVNSQLQTATKSIFVEHGRVVEALQAHYGRVVDAEVGSVTVSLGSRGPEEEVRVGT
jgi:hypothetical protein